MSDIHESLPRDWRERLPLIIASLNTLSYKPNDWSNLLHFMSESEQEEYFKLLDLNLMLYQSYDHLARREMEKYFGSEQHASDRKKKLEEKMLNGGIS